MTTTADLATESRRLYLLRTLKVSAGYRAGTELLKLALQNMGMTASTAQIKADVAWLESLGLVSTQSLPGMTIVMLRNEGVDVADGVSIVPGIARPQPE